MDDFQKLKEEYVENLMKLVPEGRSESANTNEGKVGYMQVNVSALKQAVPIVKATVTVSEDTPDGNRILFSEVTDESGKSPVLALKTPAASLSQSPSGNTVPYAVYNVSVSAQGFYTVYNVNSQVFENVLSIVSVDMVPKKETELFSEEDMTFITPPSTLIDS